eukprot:7362040-Alexandrium_andersonii.AAC.2
MELRLFKSRDGLKSTGQGVSTDRPQQCRAPDPASRGAGPHLATAGLHPPNALDETSGFRLLRREAPAPLCDGVGGWPRGWGGIGCKLPSPAAPGLGLRLQGPLQSLLSSLGPVQPPLLTKIRTLHGTLVRQTCTRVRVEARGARSQMASDCVGPGRMLNTWLGLTGNDRGNPMRPAPDMTRLCLRGGKATGVADRMDFQCNEAVVADVLLARLRFHREVLEPKERPINTTTALPSCGFPRRRNSEAQGVSCSDHITFTGKGVPISNNDDAGVCAQSIDGMGDPK